MNPAKECPSAAWFEAPTILVETFAPWLKPKRESWHVYGRIEQRKNGRFAESDYRWQQEQKQKVSWRLDDSHTKTKYCLQREKNTIDFEFSKKENKAIFDGLTYNLPVPIYLFANNIGDKDYIFEGIFQANSLSLDRQSFNLVLQDKINELENFKEYFEYINR